MFLKQSHTCCLWGECCVLMSWMNHRMRAVIVYYNALWPVIMLSAAQYQRLLNIIDVTDNELASYNPEVDWWGLRYIMASYTHRYTPPHSADTVCCNSITIIIQMTQQRLTRSDEACSATWSHITNWPSYMKLMSFTYKYDGCVETETYQAPLITMVCQSFDLSSYIFYWHIKRESAAIWTINF